MDKDKLLDFINKEQQKCVAEHNGTNDDEDRTVNILVYSAWKHLKNNVEGGTFD